MLVSSKSARTYIQDFFNQFRPRLINFIGTEEQGPSSALLSSTKLPNISIFFKFFQFFQSHKHPTYIKQPFICSSPAFKDAGCGQKLEMQTQTAKELQNLTAICQNEHFRCLWGVGRTLEFTCDKIVLRFIIICKLMSGGDIELLSSSAKKIYEFILSAKEPSQVLSQALNHLIKHSINSPEHFPFLLHRINWFQSPFPHYHDHLLKIFRLYKSTSPQSCKVVYNMLVEGFFHEHSHKQALHCFTSIFSEILDKKPLLAAIKDNYPHKLCQLQLHQLYLRNLIELCKKFKAYRTDFLQTIIENLANFDTEIVAGDEWVHKPFPNDQKIIELRHSSAKSELAQKLDVLLSQLMIYLKELATDKSILNEVLLVFQKKILPIKTTKMIQLIVFMVAQQSKARSKSFISFLLDNIFPEKKEQNWYRIFTQSNFYLFSYILRSKQVSPGSIVQTLGYLLQRLIQKLQEVQEVQIDQNVNLKELMQKREILLIIFQTIVLIKLGSQNLNHLKYSQIYQELLQKCQRKLHFDYFFDEQILKRMGVVSKSQSNIRIKFSNKFLPSTLPSTALFTDELMRIERGEVEIRREELEEFEQAPRKIHKGETPISYCSQTVI